jgi:hypothetical protein
MLTFYLGSHQPHWLERTPLPLFISHRRLAGRRTLPKARGWWALDSGGFSELSLFAMWKTSPEDYVSAVVRYDTEIGNLSWAAPQDWMCEPVMLAKTGLTVVEHQRRTIANFAYLTELWDHVSDTESPFMPVLQGWTLADYLRCWDMYAEAGINLSEYEVVGVGSVCRRQATSEIGDILTALYERDERGEGTPLHGFGVKLQGLGRYGHLLASADSMAWSFQARREPPLPGCTTHINCANCLVYASAWYGRATTPPPEPPGVQLDLFGDAA